MAEKINPIIVVVGSTMIDMITYSQKIPNSGQTVIGDSFSLGFGGKGANQAVMAARLGATVHMINTLGNDVFGESTIKNFKEQGVETTHINQVQGASGVAPIWVEPDGTNRIICVPGANNEMRVEQVEECLETIGEFSILIGQLEIPQEVTKAAFRLARRKGIPTLLNPAPFSPLSEELIELCDWIIPNESEFAGLNRKGNFPDSDEEILQVSNELRTKLVVTLGENGAAFVDSVGSISRVPAPLVKAIDTTGAGDAFVGAFAFALASGFEVKKSVLLGCLCASDSVARKGTQSSYPSRLEAAKLLASLS